MSPKVVGRGAVEASARWFLSPKLRLWRDNPPMSPRYCLQYGLGIVYFRILKKSLSSPLLAEGGALPYTAHAREHLTAWLLSLCWY